MKGQKLGAFCWALWLLTVAAQDYSESDSRAPPSAILQHKQSVTDDGVFNYVFAADNGLKQGESISPDGTRTGAYQYIDPSGKTISVKYMAGKDGFRIIEGDHVPRQPQPVEPIPEYQPPEYRESHQEGRKPTTQKYTTQEYIKSKEGNRHGYQQDYQQDYQTRQRPQKHEYQSQEREYQQQQKENRPQQQGYQQRGEYQQQQKEYRPQQQGYQQRQKEPDRAMLYNVEQRHSVSYRKYNDDGKLVGSADGAEQQDAPQPAPHFGGGYNFDFKG